MLKILNILIRRKKKVFSLNIIINNKLNTLYYLEYILNQNYNIRNIIIL